MSDLLKTLDLLQERATYSDAVLDLLGSDLACYGWCCHRTHSDGRVERIDPRAVYLLSDDQAVQP